MNANTIPPGLHNADFMARRAAALPRGVGQAHPLFATKALNAEVWDVEGRRFMQRGFQAGQGQAVDAFYRRLERDFPKT